MTTPRRTATIGPAQLIGIPCAVPLSKRERIRGDPAAAEDRVVTVRVFVIDDHELFRSGVRSELGDGLEIVGDAGGVEEAVNG